MQSIIQLAAAVVVRAEASTSAYSCTGGDLLSVDSGRELADCQIAARAVATLVDNGDPLGCVQVNGTSLVATGVDVGEEPPDLSGLTAQVNLSSASGGLWSRFLARRCPAPHPTRFCFRADVIVPPEFAIQNMAGCGPDSGLAGYQVATYSECQRAARTLGLVDTTASVVCNTDWPRFCYLATDTNTLHFNQCGQNPPLSRQTDPPKRSLCIRGSWCPTGFSVSSQDLTNENDHRPGRRNYGVSTILACKQLCRELSDCSAFEFNPASRRCDLKVAGSHRVGSGQQFTGWTSCLLDAGWDLQRSACGRLVSALAEAAAAVAADMASSSPTENPTHHPTAAPSASPATATPTLTPSRTTQQPSPQTFDSPDEFFGHVFDGSIHQARNVVVAELDNVDLGEDLSAYQMLYDDCVGEDQRPAERRPSFLKPSQGGTNQAYICIQTAMRAKKTPEGTVTPAIFHNLNSEENGGTFPLATRLAKDLSDRAGSDVNVNAYFKKPGESALPPHTDKYDVVIIQFGGRGNWTVCPGKRGGESGLAGLDRNTDAGASLWRAHADGNTPGGVPVDVDRDVFECKTVILEEKQGMFIPKHVVHSATAIGDEVSMHFTMGVLGSQLTFHDAVDSMIDTFPGSERKAELKEALMKQQKEDIRLHLQVPEDFDPAALDPIVDSLFKSHCDTVGPKRGLSCDVLDRKVYRFFGPQRRSESLQRSIAYTQKNPDRPRARRQYACCIGEPSAYFVCPGDPTEHERARSERGPNVNHNCDVGFWNCDRDDPNRCYYRCENRCDVCTCPRGSLHRGCSVGSQDTGACELNEAGAFCNEESGVETFCRDGLACVGGACCNPRVELDHCTECERGAQNGRCVAWEPGYTGPEARSCAEGYFPSGGTCLPEGEGGNNCTDDLHCVSRSCKGGVCCTHAAAAAVRCSECGASGECRSCNALGLAPATNCATCNPGYYGLSDGGYVACFPLEQSGRSCSTAGQCRANDCRGERCCAALSPFTVRTCSACNVDGSCVGCRDGFTAAGRECYFNCINAAGEEVAHGGTDSRNRYAMTAPTAGQRCADMLSVEQRSCANETWSSWAPVSSENIGQPFPHSECFDNCPIPEGLAGINIKVCPSSPAAIGNDGHLNSTSCRQHAGQWVAYESIVLQERYATPEVDTGELCTLVEVVFSCASTGELEAYQRDVEEAAPYFQCAPKCAPACRLVMEHDGDDCHPGCNVAACRYQHGTCTLIAQRRSLAAHEALMLKTERGVQQGAAIFEELCGEEVLGSPAQQAVRDDACRVNRYVAAGRDPDGHGSNWVFSLSLTQYLDAAEHLLRAMVVVEAEMRALEANADRERQDSLLVGKITLLLQDISGHFSALAVTDTTFRSVLNVTMRSLTASMQAQYVLVRQELGRLLRGQTAMSGQITRAVTSLRADELVSTNAMQATAERNYRGLRDLVTRSTDVVLRGQQAILEDIAEQRAVIDELHEIVLRQSANTNVQDQFTAVLSGYFASKERVANQTQIATRVFAKFGPDQAGWDTDLDGLMSAEELYEMLKDLGLLNPYAKLYMSLVFHHQARGTIIQAVDFAHLVMIQAGPPADRWVKRETGLDEVDSDAADVNGDGAFDGGEALLVLANNYGLMGSGIDMVRNWARQAYGPQRRRSVAGSVSEVSWGNFTACDGARQIGVALREESSSIGVGPIAEVGNVMRAVMDGIGAIGFAFADAVGSCTNFLRRLVEVALAVCTGGLSAIVLSVVAVVASAAECAETVNNLVNQVSNTFNDAISGYAVLVDVVENGQPDIVNWAASRATDGAINVGCGPLAAVVGSVAPTVDTARAASQGIRNAASRTVRLVERLDAQLRQVGTNATEPVRLSHLGLTSDSPALYVQSSEDDIANVEAHLPGVLSEVRQVIQEHDMHVYGSRRSLTACNAWIEEEIGNGSAWQRQVEEVFPCPCDEQRVIDASPNPWVAEDGFWRAATHFWRLSRYHPGADECYRAGPTTGGHGQQCCYRDGRLLTTGAGAGTMDKAHAGNRDAHVEIDVVPFGWCGEASGWRNYTRARPTSNILSCPAFERRRSLHEDQSDGATTGRGDVSFLFNVQEDALVVQMVLGMARTNNNIAESATAIASSESAIELENRYQEELVNRSNDAVPVDGPAQNAAVILEQQLNNMRRRMLSYIWRCTLTLGAMTHEDEAVPLRNTTAAEFGRVLNVIRYQFLTWRESSVARTRTQMTVVYTVFCNEHPAECAKLTDPTGSAAVALFVRPPNASDFCETAVNGVNVRFLPSSVADEVVHVVMAKDGCSGSTYFRRGGNLRTAVRYQHETRTFDDHYFADDCRSASVQTTPEGTFRVSPYGVWHLWTRSLFQQPVQQMRVEFQLETSLCPSDDRTSPSRPMFADDRVAPNGVDFMHPNDSRCDLAALHPDVSCNSEADPDRCAQFSPADCLDIAAANLTCPVLCGACAPATSTVAPTSSPTRSPTMAPTSSPTRSPTVAPTSSPTRSPTTGPTRCDYNIANLWNISECQQAYDAGECDFRRPIRYGWGAGTWFDVCKLTCHGCTVSPTVASVSMVEEEEKQGLGADALAGIIVALLVLLVFLSIAVMIFARTRNRRTITNSEHNGESVRMTRNPLHPLWGDIAFEVAKKAGSQNLSSVGDSWPRPAGQVEDTASEN